MARRYKRDRNGRFAGGGGGTRNGVSRRSTSGRVSASVQRTGQRFVKGAKQNKVRVATTAGLYAAATVAAGVYGGKGAAAKAAGAGALVTYEAAVMGQKYKHSGRASLARTVAAVGLLNSATSDVMLRPARVGLNNRAQGRKFAKGGAPKTMKNVKMRGGVYKVTDLKGKKGQRRMSTTLTVLGH